MKKIYFSLLFVLAFFLSKATNYYVDAVNGNNGYSGTGPAQAFQTIQTAAALTNAGDTVFIMNGTYTTSGTILNITRSGDASGQIVYTAYPGHSPKIKASVSTYNLITIAAGVSYITINGLEVEGWGVNMSLASDTAAAQAQQTCATSGSASTGQAPVNKYNQNGISGDSRSLGTTAGSTHIVISKCVVHDCGGCGIAMNQCDYITYDGNTVYNCAWYSIYGCSGITVNNHYNSDNNISAYKNSITNNVSYNNRMYVLWRAVCQITDGNGIILDVPNTDYAGRTLVANNVSYNNGGSGIHSFKFPHTTIIHNTAYYNSQSPAISSGEIYARNADDIKIINNILVSAPGEAVSGSYSTTNLTEDYNIYYGTGAIDVVGTHSIIQDPKFLTPSTNPAVVNFHLQAGSTAINNGDNGNSTATDKDGAARPIGTAVEMGAYEMNVAGPFTSTGTQQIKTVGTGNGTGEPGIGAYYGPYDSRPGTAGQKSRHAVIYPQAVLNNAAIPANSIINSLQFRRGQYNPGTTTASTQGVPDNSIVRIYLRNESTDNFGSAAFDWTSILPGASNPAVLVYGGEAAPLIGTAGGAASWQTVNFQVPFIYTGSHLGVYIEYLQKGSAASAPDISWFYDNGGSQPLYNTTTYPNQLYATKATASTGTLSTSLTTNNERRPVMKVGYYASLVLPVAIVQFSAVKKGSGVDVAWLTATETANAGFAVQRSLNGSDFGAIGAVDSKAPGGNSTTPIAYSFTDDRPVKGMSFYRLQQKDKDGKVTYSAIATVHFSDKGLSLLSLYPNPVKNKLAALVYADGESVSATVSIRDVTGRLLQRFQKNTVAGYNRIELDVTKQASGMYVLTIETGSGEKLIKQFVIN